MKYKEYKKVLKSKHIDNDKNFTHNLEYFLKENQGIKIINIIHHVAYAITIIYEELILIEK